ncbi:transposase, partial [Lactiplantibacillus plantarum]|nr:transposase [Lactiplantibacillus plantarum]MBU7459586.1 transposase [Lactiplantibacillus plantarum]
MPTRYDKEFKQNIINLYKQGKSAAQLAREYGIGYSTVHWATRPPYKLKLQHL